MEDTGLIWPNNNDASGKGVLREWRTVLKRGTTPYRITGNKRNRQMHFVAVVVCMGILILLILSQSGIGRSPLLRWHLHAPQYHYHYNSRPYNNTYPLSPTLSADGMTSYRIGIVADLDTDSLSKDAKSWHSYLKKGYLSYSETKKTASVTWDSGSPQLLTSSYALKGRGMELSELVVFDGRLLTFDDRSGMIYEILDDKMIPWVILVDGDGRSTKGFKSEWATVRGEILYVGSMGKEWTTPSGQFESHDPMWVKTINMNGEVRHEDWMTKFKALRSAIGIEWPGYMIHESGAWSEHLSRWAFLPRRCSFEMYNETKDETKGCNYLITANTEFSSIDVVKIGEQIPTHGFSSFKFLPGTNDQIIVALRTTEYHGSTATYIMVFDINGDIIMEETFIDNMKYEGLEFI